MKRPNIWNETVFGCELTKINSLIIKMVILFVPLHAKICWVGMPNKMRKMKRNFLQFAIFGLVVAVASTSLSFKSKVDLAKFKTEDVEMCYHVPSEKEVALYEEVNDRYQVFLSKSYIAFKEALAFKESRGNYKIVNTLGYLGKYQFNKNTLKAFGIKNTDTFLNDTRLQEDAFLALTSRNKWLLRNEIQRYVGKRIAGVKVTESGILAAAHLAGAGNVRKYLRSGGVNNFADAYGTTIRYYLKRFSGYDTSIIEPMQKRRLL